FDPKVPLERLVGFRFKKLAAWQLVFPQVAKFAIKAILQVGTEPADLARVLDAEVKLHRRFQVYGARWAGQQKIQFADGDWVASEIAGVDSPVVVEHPQGLSGRVGEVKQNHALEMMTETLVRPRADKGLQSLGVTLQVRQPLPQYRCRLWRHKPVVGRQFSQQIE